MKKRFLFTALLTIILAITICIMPKINTKAIEIKENHQQITHLFTHALVANPELAFSKDNPMCNSYNKDCITAKEFNAILKSLYEKNYALVDIQKIYSNGKRREFLFPSNKKPLILSFDDINYYSKKMGLGMNDKLILANGKLASSINGKINYNNEVVTILENFIEKHPDFSYDGAKGILCLTGFNGILGYRTQPTNPNSDEEIKAVKPLVANLKKQGWRFACHSYGHYHMKQITKQKFESDTKKWIEQVEPLVGKTDIYVYPYGEHDVLADDGSISEKHKCLQDNGFTLFCGVGLEQYYGYFPKKNNNSVLFMDRAPLDGHTLRTQKQYLNRYFDFNDVYDFKHRPN